jgi:hypothetical protein
VRLPEEIAFFARSAAYALVVAIAYWFLTYEVAGTILLGGFGVASAVLVGLLFWKRPRPAGPAGGAGPSWSGPLDTAPDGPFGNESGAVPAPTMAPLQLGFGLAVLVLTVPFGPAMALAAVVPLVVGAVGWLRAVEAEPAFRDEHRDEDTPLG